MGAARQRAQLPKKPSAHRVLSAWPGAQAEAGAAQLLERIAVAHDEYTAQHASLASQLGAAARDAAAADAAAAEAAAQAGSRPQGLDEAAVHARMAAAAAEARMHEAAIAAQEARARLKFYRSCHPCLVRDNAPTAACAVGACSAPRTALSCG